MKRDHNANQSNLSFVSQAAIKPGKRSVVIFGTPLEFVILLGPALTVQVFVSFRISHLKTDYKLQRFSEVPDQLGKAILSVTSENQLLWTF